MNLIIRADASINIGTGHMMRCLALAQAWQNTKNQVIFVMATLAPVLEERLLLEKMKVVYLSVSPGSAEDAEETANLAHRLYSSWVVVDGYYFGANYQQIIKSFGLSLLFIDDYAHADHYYADLILNQNIYAHKGLYVNREPYTQMLLGTQYTLLRQEFWHWQKWQRAHPIVASKLLVTMGGADADNVTFKAIQALQLVEVKDLEIVVVVGGSNPHYEQLQSACQKSPFPMSLEKNVTNMPDLMAWADVALTAGGSTCWELAFMGLPSLIIILSENQRAIAQKIDEIGASVNLGWHEDVSVAEIASAVTQLLVATRVRLEITHCGQKLVDHKGSFRVVTAVFGDLVSFFYANSLTELRGL